MDSSVAKARAARAESWRTKRSLGNIVANLEGARSLFATPGGFADLLAAAGSAPLAAAGSAPLAAAGSAPLADGIKGQFDTVIASAKNLGMPLEDALGDTAMRPKLDDLLRQLRSLRVLIQGPLSAETELTVGFNSLDGD
jgi:predicted lipoprotein